MKKLFTLGLAISLLASCSRGGDSSNINNNPQNATNLGELTIPDEFNWSSSQKGQLNVSLDVPSEMGINGQFLYLVDDQMNVLDQKKVADKSVNFYYNAPQNNTTLSLYHEGSETVQEISGAGNVTFKIEDVDRIALADADNSSNKKAKTYTHFKTAANQLINSDFSTNDIGYQTGGYSSLRPQGKWYNTDNNGSIQTVSGDQVYQNTDYNNYTCIFQSVAIASGSSYTFSATYGTTGSYKKSFWVDFFDANGTWLSGCQVSTGNNQASKTGTAPNNAAYMQVYISIKRYTWVDDVTLDVTPAISDSDNDGVADDQDDYPNDPARAYTSYFPSSGYQTVSFEDLWPAKGDFDLNDMVLTNNVVYTKDANNNLVDGTFTISLDAVGSGFSNGLAIVFTDGSMQPLNQSIISSVTGDATADPNVTNGIVVFDDVYTAQSTYYQNNGVGPAESADVFTFTVNFNSNAGSQTIIPDVYIYRTTDRGLEVHLDGFTGTSAANSAYNNTVDDINGTYSTENGLPWVLEIVTPDKSYKHPLEKVDILVAYPQFQGWAESSGSQNSEWLDNPVSNQIFQ